MSNKGGSADYDLVSDSLTTSDNQVKNQVKTKTTKENLEISKKESKNSISNTNNLPEFDINKFVNNELSVDVNQINSKQLVTQKKVQKDMMKKLFDYVGEDMNHKIIPYVALMYTDFDMLKKIAPLEYNPEITEILPGKDNLDLYLVNGIFGIGTQENYIIQLVYQNHLHEMFEETEIEKFIQENEDVSKYIDANYVFDGLLNASDKKFDFPIEQLIRVMQNF